MALDIFINMGSTIQGDSSDKIEGPKRSIDVLAWSWGMTQSGTTHLGTGAGAGKASFQDLSFTKYVDSASSSLMLALAKGSRVSQATLTVRRSGPVMANYITIVLADVLVTSLSSGASGGEDRVTENVTLNFGKVTYSFYPQAKDGSVGPAKAFGWNIATNTQIS